MFNYSILIIISSDYILNLIYYENRFLFNLYIYFFNRLNSGLELNY